MLSRRNTRSSVKNALARSLQFWFSFINITKREVQGPLEVHFSLIHTVIKSNSDQ